MSRSASSAARTTSSLTLVSDLLERAREVAVFVDVADELVGEELLARSEVEQRDLIVEWSARSRRVDGDRLVVLALFVLFAAAAGVEAVEEDLLPVDLVVGCLLFLGLLLSALDALAPRSSSSSSSGSTMSRNGLFSSSCLRCCCRSSSGM